MLLKNQFSTTELLCQNTKNNIANGCRTFPTRTLAATLHLLLLFVLLLRFKKSKKRYIFSRCFSKKNADYSSDFSFKTNEVTDLISFYKLVCSFVYLLGRLIFRLREAGERGFESRTKPNIV